MRATACERLPCSFQICRCPAATLPFVANMQQSMPVARIGVQHDAPVSAFFRLTNLDTSILYGSEENFANAQYPESRRALGIQVQTQQWIDWIHPRLPAGHRDRRDRRLGALCHRQESSRSAEVFGHLHLHVQPRWPLSARAIEGVAPISTPARLENSV